MATCSSEKNEKRECFYKNFSFNDFHFSSQISSKLNYELPLEQIPEQILEQVVPVPSSFPSALLLCNGSESPCISHSTEFLNMPNYNFSVSVDSTSGRRQFITSESGKYLITNKEVCFAAQFTSLHQLPLNGFIRAFVLMVSDSKALIKACDDCTVNNTDSLLSGRFITCTTPGAIHCELSNNGHHVIDIAINDLIKTSETPFAVYNFKCRSSHIKKSNCNLSLEFQLLNSTKNYVLGSDSIGLKVCSCVVRDTKKLISKISPVINNTQAKTPLLKKRKVSVKGESPVAITPTSSSVLTPPMMTPEIPRLPLVFPLDFTQDAQPDKNGYYNFTWKGKDKTVFNLLSIFKKSSELGDD